jgi:hypothetical protein
MKTDLTQELLKRYFTYDPESGNFIRIIRRNRWGERVCFETIVSRNNRGYFWVRIFGEIYLVHRLVFLYMTGKHPYGEVDHVNGDRLDNRWVNLRDVNPFENSRNQGNRIDNSTGVRGVTYRSTGRGLKRWKARISHMGRRYDLGEYLTKEEAVTARMVAEKQFGYHPNHARRESWRG